MLSPTFPPQHLKITDTFFSLSLSLSHYLYTVYTLPFAYFCNTLYLFSSFYWDFDWCSTYFLHSISILHHTNHPSASFLQIQSPHYQPLSHLSYYSPIEFRLFPHFDYFIAHYFQKSPSLSLFYLTSWIPYHLIFDTIFPLSCTMFISYVGIFFRYLIRINGDPSHILHRNNFLHHNAWRMTYIYQYTVNLIISSYSRWLQRTLLYVVCGKYVTPYYRIIIISGKFSWSNPITFDVSCRPHFPIALFKTSLPIFPSKSLPQFEYHVLELFYISDSVYRKNSPN